MLKSAVIGCGRMGARSSSVLQNDFPNGWLPLSHIEALLEISSTTLVAVCDIVPEVLNTVGHRYAIKNLYTSYTELIDKEKPDVITIATRTPEKKEIIEYACRHGVKGIYLEKPIANSLIETKQILSMVKDAGIKLSYGVNRRYHNIYSQAKNMVDDGLIGKLENVQIDLGRAALLWTHPHSVDLILYFIGSTAVESVQSCLEPDSFQKQEQYLIDSDPVVENAYFKFSCGTIGRISSIAGMNVLLGGSLGNIVIHANGNSIELLKPRDHPSYFTKRTVVNGSAKKSATIVALENLTSSVLNREPLLISHGEIEAGMKMLMGCVWSYLNGQSLVKYNTTPSQLCVTGKLLDQYP